MNDFKERRGVVSLWLPASDKTADRIARNCIEETEDGGYLFHHAKATALIDKVIREAIEHGKKLGRADAVADGRPG